MNGLKTLAVAVALTTTLTGTVQADNTFAKPPLFGGRSVSI
jgi:hypothetical protein